MEELNDALLSVNGVIRILDALTQDGWDRATVAAWAKNQKAGSEWQNRDHHPNCLHQARWILGQFKYLTLATSDTDPSFFLRDTELQGWRDDLVQFPLQRRQGSFREWDPVQDYRFRSAPIMSLKRTRPRNNHPLSYSKRSIYDMPCRIASGSILFRDVPFYLVQVLDPGPDYGTFRLEADIDAEHDQALLADLLKELGFGFKDLTWFQFKGSADNPHLLFRYDDNGGEFLMARFDSYLEAEMTRQMYEDRGHKQIYYLKKAD